MKTYVYKTYAPLLLSQPWMSTWSLSPKIHSTLFLNFHWGRRARSGIAVLTHVLGFRGSQVVLVVKNPPANAGDRRDTGSIPGSGRSPGGGHGNPLQYSCLENSRNREAWQALVHGVTQSWTQLKWFKHVCRKMKILVGWKREIGGFQMFLELNEIYSL